jgi:hypothetical protein
MQMTIHLTPVENGWIIDLPKAVDSKPAMPVKHVATTDEDALEIVRKAMQPIRSPKP